jgi:RND family efflux transporter MFP subunit
MSDFVSSPSRAGIQPQRTGIAGRLLFLAIAALSLTAGCGRGDQPAAAQQGAARTQRAAPVKTIVLRSTEIPNSSEYVGTMKSRRSIQLNPQVDGQITEIFVKSGDILKAGAPVMQIDPLKQEATVSSQEAARAAQLANVQLAQTQFDRAKQLFEAGVVSHMVFDQAQATLDNAKEQLKNLDQQVSAQQVQLQYYKVVAPTDGIVGDIPVRVGDRVTTSTLLTTMDRPGNLELYVSVPVERSKDLKMGQRVQLLDANGGVLAESHVDFIAPQVSSDTQSILAKATFENRSGTLRPSQFARTRVIWGIRQGVMLPVLAVTRINGQFFVWVVETGPPAVARQKLVHVGDLIGNDYPVLDGVQAGDHLVVEGAETLLDGAPVTETIQAEDPAS